MPEPAVVCLQDAQHVGFHSMIESIVETAQQRLAILNQRRRETCPASDLVIGVQCGGSDAFSGVTANPAVGFATDLLVRAGATVMFSGSDRSTRWHRSTHLARCHARNRACHDSRDGVVRQLLEARRR